MVQRVFVAALLLALMTVSLPLHAQTDRPAEPPPMPVSASVNAEDPYDPSMPSYSIASEDAVNKLSEYCAGMYNPTDSLLTTEQAAFKRDYQAALNAEVQKCLGQFSGAEVASHRRLAMRYCLGNNNYTGTGEAVLTPAAMQAYDQCMYANDTLTAFCNIELRYRGVLSHMPNPDRQICPAPRPNAREALVILNGGHADMGHPGIIPPSGPGLPAVLQAPMDAGLLQLSLPSTPRAVAPRVMERGPAPFSAPAPSAGMTAPAAPPSKIASPMPAEQAAAQARALQEQRAAANREKAVASEQAAAQARACMQQVKNDHPGMSDLAAAQKQFRDCMQGVQSGPAK